MEKKRRRRQETDRLLADEFRSGEKCYNAMQVGKYSVTHGI